MAWPFWRSPPSKVEREIITRKGRREGSVFPRSTRSVGGADDGERFLSFKSFAYEVEEAALWLDGNDVERNEDSGCDEGADHVLVVGIKNSEIVLPTVIGGGGDDLKPLREKPIINLGLGHGDQLETRLRYAYGEVTILDDDAFEAIQARSDKVWSLRRSRYSSGDASQR